jgi:cytidylate kinase
MFIVHVSGPCGAGKTTLGDAVRDEAAGIFACDTDTFIQGKEPVGLRLLQLEADAAVSAAEYDRVWCDGWKDGIERVLGQAVASNARVVVFVGLTDNFAREAGMYYTGRLARADVTKIYLDVPRETRWLQFDARQRRAVRAPCPVGVAPLRLKDEAEYGAACNEHDRWHDANGYRRMAPRDALSFIRTLATLAQ